MKQVRQNVFETNSSSTHSVSIAYGSRNELREIPIPDSDGIVWVCTGEYGWEQATYSSLEDRLSYAATYALNYGKEAELTAILKEYSGASEIYYDGAVFTETEDYGQYGYIDHQSVDEAAEIFTSKENLECFLFNPNSYFTTDNDNH